MAKFKNIKDLFKNFVVVDKKGSAVDTKLHGSFATRFVVELFGNTAIFPIANILYEILIEGFKYLKMPDLYILVISSLVQAYFFVLWSKSNKKMFFFGNQIAPTLYTLADFSVEGWGFFHEPQHIAYIIFSFLIGTIQYFKSLSTNIISNFLQLFESILKSSILFFMYALFETHSNPTQTVSFVSFFSDKSHQYIAFFVLFLGVSVGLANITANKSLNMLIETSKQLKTYSEWLLGNELLQKIINSKEALSLRRIKRVILFMDIRSFTSWSDKQLPDNVASLLDEYYNASEAIINKFKPVKYKFAADEMLVVFKDAIEATEAAVELSNKINDFLLKYNLGVGIGINAGEVAEGLIGTQNVKFYDVLGDVVNVAKRLESYAKKGEILISEAVKNDIGDAFDIGEIKEITVKGKKTPLVVYNVLAKKT